jgi:hypothetical protein
MEKVYWLLRNNNECGPYTIGELLQQQLTSSDLIWVEGISSAWCYPSEIEELFPEGSRRKNDLNTSPDSSGVFRSEKRDKDNEQKGRISPDIRKRLPPDKEIEWRAEELRKRALSYKPSHQPGTKIPIKHPDRSYSSSYLETIESMDREPISFIYHKEKKNSYLPEIIGMLLLILAFAWYGGLSPFNQKSNIIEPAAIQVIASKNHNKRNITTNTQQYIPGSIPEVAPAVTNMNSDSLLIASLTNTVKEKPKEKPVKKTIVTAQPVIPLSLIETDIKPQQKDDLIAPAPPVEKALKDQDKNAMAVATVTEDPAPEATEKKKSFGQVLKGLFKKKKKEEEKLNADSSRSNDVN